jgi:hypothetical protein
MLGFVMLQMHSVALLAWSPDEAGQQAVQAALAERIMVLELYALNDSEDCEKPS